jgi:DNA-binding NtrC family response regulator
MDRRAHVLVVDMDEQIRDVVREALESALGYTVSSAPSAAAAVSLLRRTVIDVAIVDLALPPGEPSIAAHAGKLGIPVILMVSDPGRLPEWLPRPRRLLAKPFRLEQLSTEVAGALVAGRALRRHTRPPPSRLRH